MPTPHFFAFICTFILLCLFCLVVWFFFEMGLTPDQLVPFINNELTIFNTCSFLFLYESRDFYLFWKNYPSTLPTAVK